MTDRWLAKVETIEYGLGESTTNASALVTGNGRDRRSALHDLADHLEERARMIRQALREELGR